VAPEWWPGTAGAVVADDVVVLCVLGAPEQPATLIVTAAPRTAVAAVLALSRYLARAVLFIGTRFVLRKRDTFWLTVHDTISGDCNWHWVARW
jgi:hypothetical protein